jgi:sugar phosphate isomerase/epimerase
LALVCLILFCRPAASAANSAFGDTPVPASELFAPKNLVAWCIVPFDARHRGPHDRVDMLARLGFTQYAWDWRDEHLKDLPEELRYSREKGVRMVAIWLWIEKGKDAVGRLSDGNRAVMASVKAAGASVDYWLGFHENFFEGLDASERVTRAAEIVAYVAKEAAAENCTVSLYNHGGWFGESANEIAIIEASRTPELGMIYNFHHARHEIDRFAENLARMRPYLRTVNINGMNPDGPMILPIGGGTREAEMLRILRKSGYRGPIGILGHVADADVEGVLKRNLDGLRTLVPQL